MQIFIKSLFKILERNDSKLKDQLQIFFNQLRLGPKRQLSEQTNILTIVNQYR